MSSKQKVVVIGGGISGKLAARVLSDFFQEVVILERDPEPVGPFPRKGAPQGAHLHALLHAGEAGLEALFPGITEKFYSSGAIKINATKDLAWFHHGVWKLRFDSGFTTTLQTRPLLEWHIDQFMKKIPNVTIHYSHAVQNFLYNEEENCMVGVEVKDGYGITKTFTSDLIVDASGVSSLSSNWLSKRGIPIPDKKVKIDLSYFSKTFQLVENEDRDWAIKIVYPTPPYERIGGTISKVEGGRYTVTLNSYHNEVDEKEVLKDKDGFINLAKKLPKLDIYQEIKDAQPVNETSIYRVPSIIWKQFDKAKNLPDRLLLIGDTICRIDPVFGQGVSIAVLETLALQKLLQNNRYSQSKMIKLFHKQATKIIAPIWNMVVTEDFRYPETTGKKPAGLFIQQWYAKNIFLLSAHNQDIYQTLFKVMNLIHPIRILMRPRVLNIVLKWTFSKNKNQSK